MEQDFVAELYRSLGLPVGAELSCEDVSLLFQKVFHVSSNTEEAYVAMKEVAGGDSSWCCVGENMLDVLVQMDKELERKDKLYWDLQLLNAGNLNTYCVTGERVIVDPHRKNSFHQSTNGNILRKVHNQSESEYFHQGICGTYSPPRFSLRGNKEPDESVRAVRRLKKAARHSWARLISEGVKSIIPSSTQRESLHVKCQAWGCVSLLDVLLLIEVKYDVVTHLLYTEMLQEHYTLSIWETLPLWQQQQEEQELEDLAVEALDSGDMLHLAELPGAFRMYRSHPVVPFKSSSESREVSWSAVSFLCELHTYYQQEKETLTVLCKRLDRDELRLICLYIRLATLKAQRENISHKALLAARQSWKAWPHIRSTCTAEQASLWLHEEKEEQKSDFITVSPQQQEVLQLLVLTQEQARRHLIKLLHGVSPEDLQESGCTVLRKGESPEQSALRDSCIKRLKQIYDGMKKQHETQTTSKQTNSQPQLQPGLQMNHHSSNMEAWTQQLLDECSLLLLIQVIELQEVQASELLPALMEENCARALRNKYESQLQAPDFSLQLLISEAPQSSGCALSPGLKQPITAQSCSGEVNAQNSSSGAAEAPAVDPIRGASRDQGDVGATDETNQQDVCTGCGAVMEDLPYLEILCASDATSNPHQSLAPERGATEEDKNHEVWSTQCVEKQGSLITLAWSKPQDDDMDGEAEAPDGQSQDPESSLKTQVQPTNNTNTNEHISQSEDGRDISRGRDSEEQKPMMNPSDPTGRSDVQVTPEKRTSPVAPEKEEFVSHCDHLSVNPPLTEHLTGDLCSSLNPHTADVGRAVVQLEMFTSERESEFLDLKDPEAAFNAQSTDVRSPGVRKSSLMQSEWAGEQVSAVERERTMRNLVDMQRKVEQRQQRDRERQLLRVQERLSIVQNRKAEEDLLGLKHTDRLKHLTQDLPQEDKSQQKTVVRERLEQLRRERSYIMQSKRERNTAGFKELLGPVALRSREADDGAD